MTVIEQNFNVKNDWTRLQISILIDDCWKSILSIKALYSRININDCNNPTIRITNRNLVENTNQASLFPKHDTWIILITDDGHGHDFDQGN